MDFDPKITAFIFPGQGSQIVGMGHGLALVYDVARHTFQEADDIIDFSLSRLMWEGPEEDLNDTVNTQPALFVHSIAALRVLLEYSPDLKPAFIAGHSLGELSALTAVGALSFTDGLRLVRRRGELMKQAGKVSPGGMAAILGLDISVLEKICAEASTEAEIVQVANDNCPGQVVISGSQPALERALVLAKAAGARRAISLAVSIAAHSPLMVVVQSNFDAVIEETHFSAPIIPVISNVTALSMNTVAELQADLRAQLTSRVRWAESVQFMVENGVGTFFELGSGAVLTGLIKRIDDRVIGRSLGSPQDFDLVN